MSDYDLPGDYPKVESYEHPDRGPCVVIIAKNGDLHMPIERARTLANNLVAVVGCEHSRARVSDCALNRITRDRNSLCEALATLVFRHDHGTLDECWWDKAREVLKEANQK